MVLHAGDGDAEASLALIQAIKAGGGPPVLLLSGADLKDEAVKDATVVPVPLADGTLLAALQKALGLDIIAPSSNTSSDSRPFKQRIDAESGLAKSAAEDRDGYAQSTPTPAWLSITPVASWVVFQAEKGPSICTPHPSPPKPDPQGGRRLPPLCAVRWGLRWGVRRRRLARHPPH